MTLVSLIINPQIIERLNFIDIISYIIYNDSKR